MVLQNSNGHNRHSIRLKDYDYTQSGYYFITICTQGRVQRFGEIINGHVQLNAAGKMLQSVWNSLPCHYPVGIDEFVIMPNHIHGIIVLKSSINFSISDAVHRLKTMTTKLYTDGVKQSNWLPYEKTLWQRNYWERIVRNEEELNRVRQDQIKIVL